MAGYPSVVCILLFDQLWLSVKISASCKKRSFFNERCLLVGIRISIWNAVGNYIGLFKLAAVSSILGLLASSGMDSRVGFMEPA